jgi:regulator of protease activity HflC (stomatin/prohibitin superfamily)
MRRTLTVAMLALVGCTAVDETEYCVETRYGKVIGERMHVGLNATVLTEATCFSLTDQNFPNSDEPERIEAQTADPVTVSGDLALVFAFDAATVYDVFTDKRSERAAVQEVQNAVREGYRNALASWTVADIFSDRRAELGDSVRAHIQRKVGDRVRIVQVFVRDIKIPPQIEGARINAARQAQILDAANKQYTIDSVNAAAKLMVANTEAQAKEMSARAYDVNPKLLDLEIARELAKMCQGTQTCVLGGSVADTWRLNGGGGR